MWKLIMRGPRGTPFEELGSFASIAEAAEKIYETEGDDKAWIFFNAPVYTLNEEPTSDADVLSHLTYQGSAHYYELMRSAH